MVKHNGLYRDFEKALGTQRTISLVFLGVGLTLFFLNISTMLSYLPVKYSEIAFDMSIFASMLIIIYATYNLHMNKRK
jgi:hypothetical protein